jgi:ketosteroid isomerase-like protein
MLEKRTIGNRWADLIRTGYEALGRGDTETLPSLLHDDAEWHGVPSGWRRRRAVCHGREEIRTCLQTFVAKGNLRGPDTWHVHEVVQSESLVAVSFSWRTPAKTTIQQGHVLRVSDERVVEIRSYARPKRALTIVEQQARSSGLAEPGEHVRRF